MGLLWATHDEHPTAQLVAVVHDEVVVECDEHDSEAVATWVAECLQTGMETYLHRVPVSVTISVANTWGG